MACVRGTKKAIFRSVTVYDKNLSSQCNLLAQIEQVQDKYYFPINVRTPGCVTAMINQLTLGIPRISPVDITASLVLQDHT